jgi:glycosyltransferase involved in cell wall biosynthesis
MRILLYDRYHGGHHLQHVDYLSRHFISCGDEVLFVTGTDSEHLDRLPNHLSGFDVHVLNHTNQEVNNNQRPDEQLMIPFRHAAACHSVARSWDADVLHFLYLDRNEAPLFCREVLSAALPCPLFGTLITPYFIYEHRSVGWMKQLYHMVNRRMLCSLLKRNRLAGLFTLSRMTADFLRDVFGPVPERKIMSVPDPIEPVDPSLTKQGARQRLGLPEDRTVMLFFGETRRDKGPDVLLKATAHIRDPVAVVFAGAETFVTSRDLRAVERERPDVVQLVDRLGFVPDANVADYFVAADVVVTPYRSSYTGMSGVIQHAAAADRPIVTTDTGYIGEVVREQKLGIVVSPEQPRELGTALQSFADGRMDSTDVNRETSAYVDRHHWKRMGKRVRGRYEQVIG